MLEISEEIIDQQNDISTSSNFVDEDKLLENSNVKCIENVNDFDNIKCPNTLRNNNLKTINTISMMNNANNNCDNKLIKTNYSNHLSQSNQKDNNQLIKTFIAICCSNNASINSQDEQIVLNMVKSNLKDIFTTSVDLTDINTQQFMDLNLQRAIYRLQGSQQHENVSKIQSNEHTESDSIYFTPLSMKPISDTSINSKHDSTDFKSVDLKTPEELNYTSSKTNIALTNCINDNELRNQDEDPEIIDFRAMCEAMTKIGTIDKQVKLNSNLFTAVKNQSKNVVLRKVTADLMIVDDDIECVPSTSKTFSSVDSNDSNHTSDISKRKRHDSYSPTLNLFSESSSKYLNKLSQNQFNYRSKNKKLTALQNTSKIQSKSCPKEIENQLDKKAMNSIDLTSSEDEDFMLVENQSSKVNSANISCKRKSVHSFSSQKNKLFIGKEQIFYCSPDGLIHRDMINYINQKNVL